MANLLKTRIGLVLCGLIALSPDSSKTCIAENIPDEIVRSVSSGSFASWYDDVPYKSPVFNNCKHLLKNTKGFPPCFAGKSMNFFRQPDSLACNAAESDTLAIKIIEYSKQFLGCPYRRGSKGPKSFDCSGFTSYIYRHFGYRLGASCRTQINEGEKIGKDQLKPGDLIFFKGRNSQSKYTGHVGIVVTNDQNLGVTFIHASVNKGIKIDALDKSEYYEPRYITGLRIVK